jgi:hypothetical protein
VEKTVLKGYDFTVIRHGRVLVLAFESDAQMRDMARSLTRLCNMNEMDGTTYSRVMCCIKSDEPMTAITREEIDAALAAADEAVPRPNAGLPVLNISPWMKR